MQAYPQATPLHVGEALAGAVHAVHDEPHVAMSMLLTHTPPHRWKPALHAKPHVVPSHVVVALAGAGAQGAHRVPHELVLVLLRHRPPQRWNPGLHVKPQMPAAHVAVALTGALQAVVQLPQKAGSVVVFTHCVPHRVGVVPEQPLEHEYTPPD